MRRSDEVDNLIRNTVPDIPGAALVAVGGYGRQDLFPHSDIDLLLLSDTASVPHFSHFFRSLWDHGLRVSHSTRTVAQCIAPQEENLELTLSLIDRRYLSGDLAVWNKFDQGFSRLFARKRDRIALATARRARERHGRYQNTIYHLEPNIKEGPGGLRDVHTLQWFAGGQNVEQPAAKLAILRTGLHLHFGRDMNILTFEAQDKLGDSPDLVMARYFCAARKIQRAVNAWMEAEEEHNTPFVDRVYDATAKWSTDDFSVRHGKIYLRHDHPPEDLGIFLLSARHGFRLSPEAGRDIHDRVLHPQVRWQQLQELLALPQAALALREMHDTGVLGRIFPSWARVEGLVIRDYYHQYTVDEHSLVAIENVLRLREEPSGPFPALARETGSYPLLLLALLLHDTGKGQGAGTHAEASVKSAAPELVAIGMPEQDRDLVLFLIGNHLEMSRIMTTRDLSAPETAATVAALTGNQERLALLTLMTHADISAVNPNALTPWRTTLLWQLYAATAQLPGSAPTTLKLRSGVALTRDHDIWTLALAVPDRPFLFASVAGALSSFGMDILRAEAYTELQQTACERFTFEDPFHTLEMNPEEVNTLTTTVERAAAGLVDVPKLLERRMRRHSPSTTLEVHFDGKASKVATVLTITAADRPGLLYELSQAISSEGCNIETVLINTEGRKAVDVFYVTASGQKLSKEKEAQLALRIHHCAV